MVWSEGGICVLSAFTPQSSLAFLTEYQRKWVQMSFNKVPNDPNTPGRRTSEATAETNPTSERDRLAAFSQAIRAGMDSPVIIIERRRTTLQRAEDYLRSYWLRQ